MTRFFRAIVLWLCGPYQRHDPSLELDRKP